MFYVVIDEVWNVAAFETKGEAFAFLDGLRMDGNNEAYFVKGM